MGNSSSVSLFTSQDKTTEDVFTVRQVNRAGEAAQYPPQAAEEAFRQVGGF